MTVKQYNTLLDLVKNLSKEISKLNTQPFSQAWFTKTQLKQIFGYSENSLRKIEPFLEISQIRSRKFYSTKSVLKYIESGLIHSELKQKQNNNSL